MDNVINYVNLVLLWMFTFGYISHRLVFLCLVKLTINKTIDCLFDCQLREVGKVSKCQKFWATNDLDFIHLCEI